MTTSTGPAGGDPYRGTGSWSYRAPDAGPPPDGGGGDMLSRRLLQAAGVLSVVLIALVAYSWATGGEDTDFNPIARAAARAEHSPGVRFAIHATVTPEGSSSSFSMDGDGAYNGRNRRSSLQMSAAIPGRGTIRIEAVGVGALSYTRSSAYTDLPAGKEWMAVEAAGSSASSELGGGGDLQEQLKMLQAVSDDIEDLGEAEVRGVPTTAYRATVDPDREAALLRREGDDAGAREIEKIAALSGGADQEVTVWIDAKGLMRAMHLVLPFPSIEGRPGSTVDMTVDFHDFGVTPHVSVPAPGRVLDATAVGRAELGLLDGSTVHFPRPAENAPALTAAGYRKRANDACRALEGESHRFSQQTKAGGQRLKELAERDGRNAALAELPSYYLRYVEPELRWAERSLGRITRLPPPPQLQGAVDRYDHLVALQLETLFAATRAGELNARPLVKRMERRGKALGHRANRLAKSIGLNECGKSANA